MIMFGGKLRSWMEAVRPRKKQQRKEKHKSNNPPSGKLVTTFKPSKPYSSENEISVRIDSPHSNASTPTVSHFLRAGMKYIYVCVYTCLPYRYVMIQIILFDSEKKN